MINSNWKEVIELIESLEKRYGSIKNVPANDISMLKIQKLVNANMPNEKELNTINSIDEELKTYNPYVKRIETMLRYGYSISEIAEKENTSVGSINGFIGRFHLKCRYYRAEKNGVILAVELTKYKVMEKLYKDNLISKLPKNSGDYNKCLKKHDIKVTEFNKIRKVKLL
ncbi:hypothetical protein [Apilactobacillus quenuiae]|uniref:hypothetical protein n=1 Tax=Apilactobacillus quenuiae TaxID=2008377 RepID=UPI000D014BC6|nr:hypothetical protein [Apilactobacillus quenuiae]